MAIRKESNLTKSKKDDKSKIFSESLYKGACVKIKNSQKTFQVIGLNPKNKICWVREWPFPSDPKSTFPLHISQITFQTFCSNNFTK